MVSGRGVGMDAVKAFLGEQGATIQIALEDTGTQEFNFTPFKFIITIPHTART
jgi:chemotaxis protein histidine kinase CheA